MKEENSFKTIKEEFFKKIFLKKDFKLIDTVPEFISLKELFKNFKLYNNDEKIKFSDVLIFLASINIRKLFKILEKENKFESEIAEELITFLINLEEKSFFLTTCLNSFEKRKLEIITKIKLDEDLIINHVDFVLKYTEEFSKLNDKILKRKDIILLLSILDENKEALKNERMKEVIRASSAFMKFKKEVFLFNSSELIFDYPLMAKFNWFAIFRNKEYFLRIPKNLILKSEFLFRCYIMSEIWKKTEDADVNEKNKLILEYLLDSFRFESHNKKIVLLKLFLEYFSKKNLINRIDYFPEDYLLKLINIAKHKEFIFNKEKIKTDLIKKLARDSLLNFYDIILIGAK